MSLLDEKDTLMERTDNDLNNRFEIEEIFVKELFGNGLVTAVVIEEQENLFAKKLAGVWHLNIDYKTSFAQRIDKIIQNAIAPELQEYQSRNIYSIDCRALHKGDAYGWLSTVEKAGTDNPILVIENVTQIPDGDRTIYDDPMYVTNLLLRSWKNEDIFAGDLHIDRRQFTIILTSPPQDAGILQRECGLCSYGWLGDFDEYLKECQRIASL